MDDSSITIDEAMRLHSQGESQAAIAAYEAILRREPDNHRAANLLGRLFGVRGDHESAILLLHKAVELAPKEIPYQFHLGQTLFAGQRFEDAERTLRRALNNDSENGPLLVWLANTLMATGRTEEASRMYESGISLLPADARTLMHFGDLLRDMGHDQPALATYRRWADLFPDQPAAHSRIASVHYRRRAWDDGEIACRQAIEMSPNEAFFHAQLAEIYERTNRLEAAHQAATRAIQLDDDHPQANLVLAKVLRRQEEYETPRDRLTRLIEKGKLPQRLLASMYLELGHVHDALGEFDDAFHSFQTGQAEWAATPEARSIPHETYPVLLDAYRTQITKESVITWSEMPADKRRPPVFLVGFPRSGTTLFAKILGGHSQIVAANEPPFVSRMLKAAQVIAGASQAYPNVLNLLDDRQLRMLANEYWKAVDQQCDAAELNGKLLLDQLPLNLNHLPLVRRIFPEAKVLVAIRDPRDSVLSFFFEEFSPNVAMVHSYTLDDAAALYRKVMNLWQHYRDCLGLNSIESRYEDLVDDPEGGVRRLLDFLGVAWEPSVLTVPEEGEGKIISTPTCQMVVEPVYKWSVGRWRWYEKHMSDVLPQLQPFVKEFQYD